MDFGWNSEQQDLHERMRNLGTEVSKLPTDRRMAALAAGGALGLCIKKQLGGGGADLTTTAYAYEGLGATLDDGGLLLAAGAHLFGVAMCIQRVGSAEQCERWLPDMATGACIGTVATTEVGSGSDVSAVTATITPCDDGYIACGQKRYVTFADRANLFLFVAQADAHRGLTTALVPAGDGVTVAAPLDTLGLRGARLAPVRFEACKITADHVLGKPGAGMAVFQIAMTYERALVLAFRLGAMHRQLDEAIAFVRKRRLGDHALRDHQTVTHRVARMKMRLETARLSVYRTAWLLDRGKRAQAEAALAKWQLADAAVESALDAMRLRGGAAYLRDAGLGEALDDTLGGSIHSGTADVLANIVAGWLGL